MKSIGFTLTSDEMGSCEGQRGKKNMEEWELEGGMLDDSWLPHVLILGVMSYDST